jgi:hypothetical protein
LNQPTLRRIDLGIGLGEHLLLNLIPNEFARALRENGSIAGAFRVDHSTGGQLAIVEMNQISGKRHGIASRNGTKTAWRTSNQDAIRPEHRAFGINANPSICRTARVQPPHVVEHRSQR